MARDRTPMSVPINQHSSLSARSFRCLPFVHLPTMLASMDIPVPLAATAPGYAAAFVIRYVVETGMAIVNDSSTRVALSPLYMLTQDDR